MSKLVEELLDRMLIAEERLNSKDRQIECLFEKIEDIKLYQLQVCFNMDLLKQELTEWTMKQL